VGQLGQTALDFDKIKSARWLKWQLCMMERAEMEVFARNDGGVYMMNGGNGFYGGRGG